MSRAIRIWRTICQAGIGFAAIYSIDGCRDQPRSEAGEVTERAPSEAGPSTQAKPAADSVRPASATTANTSMTATPAASASMSAAAAAGRPAAVGGAGLAGQNATTTPDGAGGMSGAAGGFYTFSQCPDAMLAAEGKANEFPACDGSVQCGDASHCVPIERLKMRISEAVIDRTPDCSGGKCMPDEIMSAGKIRFMSCTGDLGEGRCIPQCFALWTQPFSSIIERGAYGCGSQEVCAPCKNPLTGDATGACESDMCAAEL